MPAFNSMPVKTCNLRDINFVQNQILDKSSAYNQVLYIVERFPSGYVRDPLNVGGNTKIKTQEVYVCMIILD